ncbi:MAG: hypothetical protein L0I76_14345 [Pseudonocardia sp.]|nr:hypothetical protein [Pseudonocardia sp.]
MRRDVVEGALLVNTVPHAVLGCAGKRGMTPLGGPDSSPRLNLAWAGLNLAGALATVVSGGWSGRSQAEAERRCVAVGTGMAAMAAFGVAYALATRSGHPHPPTGSCS